MPQSNYIVFPSFNMVASKDRYMSEQKLSTWIANSNDTPHVIKNARNEFNWLYDSGLVATIDTGIAEVGGYTLDSGPSFQYDITLTAGTAITPLLNHVYLYYQTDSVGLVKKAQIIVIPEGSTFPDSSYVGLLLWDVECSDTTVLGAVDKRRFDAFDGTYGHKHTGEPYDAPIISFPASSTVMGDTYLSLDPVLADTPIAIGFNEKGAANGVAPLDVNTKIPWEYNYYFGPSGILLAADGTQNVAFGTLSQTLVELDIETSEATGTAFVGRVNDQGASMRILMGRAWIYNIVDWLDLNLGAHFGQGDGIRLKESPDQATWDIFPFAWVKPSNPAYPANGWSTVQELATRISTLPYVQAAWAQACGWGPFHLIQWDVEIIIQFTSTAKNFGNTVQAEYYLVDWWRRGQIIDVDPPAGGGGSTHFLAHYPAFSTKNPNWTVIGVGSDVADSKIVLDAAEIVMQTSEHTITASHNPMWMPPAAYTFGGQMATASQLNVPINVPAGGHADALYLVDINGDGLSYELWTWRSGILTKIG